MPWTPSPVSASRTASSLNGLMMAMIKFIASVAPHIAVWRRLPAGGPMARPPWPIQKPCQSRRSGSKSLGMRRFSAGLQLGLQEDQRQIAC
jgi:hypothetical protein